MRRKPISPSSFIGLSLALSMMATPATAQVLGTFKWQLAPNCNVITVTVTHSAGVYALDGFDDQCGAERRAPLVGMAVLNPIGSAELAMTIISPRDAATTHVDAAIDLGTLSGTWTDGAAGDGTFVFNGAGGGAPRPTGVSGLTRFGDPPSLVSRRADGSGAAPLPVPNGQNLLLIGARGYDGTGFAGSNSAQISMSALENWTAAGHGSRITFSTTPIGSTNLAHRMFINHDGRVGIRVADPAALLHVGGDIRIGTGTVGCVQDNDGTVLAGVCVSDLRFKREITSFSPMLDKVAALRPVHFYWRNTEFPKRAFGERESYGLIAQEAEQVLPELVTTDAEGYKAVNYSKLPLVALQAIKELKAANDTLDARNAELEQQNEAFERRLSQLEGRLQQLLSR